MRFPRITRTIRRLTMLLAAAALLLGVPAAAAAHASSATTGTGWIRLAHLSPNTPAVDVYLYSFGNSNAQIVLHHVAYGTVSPYEAVSAGDYSVAMRAAGASASSQPVLSTSVTIDADHAYTVAGMGPEKGLRLQVMDDDLTTPPGKALVRVIQASLKQQTVKVTCSGKTIVPKASFALSSAVVGTVARPSRRIRPPATAALRRRRAIISAPPKMSLRLVLGSHHAPRVGLG